jgi:cell division transport system permease protein
MMKTWLLRHLQVLVFTLGQLSRTPVTTVLSLLVIAIALALPTGLYVLADNLTTLTRGWDRGGQISLYAQRDLNNAALRKLAERVRGESDVTVVEVITREEALAEFKRHSGMGAALEALASNPLPAVLVVHPKPDLAASTIELLRSRLARLPGVELAELDLAWLQRAQALVRLAEEAVLILAILFAVAVVLIIGNITRLGVMSRINEIEITLLVGGTPAFVRRPFLYQGALQGLLGATLALGLVEGGVLVLDQSAQELARLYQSGFHQGGLDAITALIVLAGGGLLGWLGARLAVTLQMRRLLAPVG